MTLAIELAVDEPIPIVRIAIVVSPFDFRHGDRDLSPKDLNMHITF